VLSVVAYLVLMFWVNSYLKSEACRKLVSDKTGAYLKADAQYSPFSWNGTSLYSDGFVAQGRSGASFKDLKADQIRADLNLRAALSGVWLIEQLEIQNLKLNLSKQSASTEESDVRETPIPASTSDSSSTKSGWLPSRVEIRKTMIQETELSWNEQSPSEGGVQKMRLIVTPEGDAWNMLGVNGQLRQAGLPNLDIEQAKVRYQRKQLYITDTLCRLKEGGSINLSGEFHFESDPSFEMLAKLNLLSVTPFLPEDWRAKLKGQLNGDIKVNGPLKDSKSVKATGQIQLVNGQLEALPVLNQIALFTRTQQFRQIVLQRGSANFAWTDPKLIVTDFVVESQGLLCIEGNFVIENKILDGDFQVGVSAASLRWLPGAQSRVFTVERGSYYWTTMKVSGPLNQLKEDLSPRLQAAVVNEVIEGVGNAAQKGGKELEKGVKEVIDILSPLIR
jgi:hypothetical protein